jgi:hypothetical protein
MRKGLSPRQKRQNGRPNHVLPRNNFSNVWQEIVRDKVQIKHFLYHLKKLSKHRYQKWFCIFNLRLWVKSYDDKIIECKFQSPFLPRDLKIWFLAFHFAITLNQKCKIIFNTVVLTISSSTSCC